MVAVVLSAGGAAIVIALGLLFVLPERMRALYQQELDARRVAERGARAASSLAHVTDAVILVDPTGILRYWNGAAARNFGVTDPDALDRPIAAVLPEIDAIDASLARGDARAVVPIARGGFEHWFTLAENRFADGRVLVLRDVTAEQQLERTRSEFLATASHELRTPLAAVYGAVRTLRRGDRRVAPELEEQLLRIIDHEAQRLALIVDQILVSAQLDRRGLYLHREHVDLRELAESARASALLAAGPRHAIELDAPARVGVEADPSRLRQVLVNLLDNALKYSPDGGHVELRVCERDGRGRVEVADRGIGIAQESVPRIFEKFFRADPDMHTGVGGSGLGLYISRELVEQMGGTIAVDSQPGRGSTFVVELPLRE